MKQDVIEQDVRMVRAATGVILKQPFLGAVLLTMKIIPRPGILTMAMDGTNVFYDPQLLDEISSAHLEGILAEEAYHKANKHHLRRKGRDPELWNIACDYQIHNDLLKDGFTFPKSIYGRDMYHDPQYDGLSAEDIYFLLEQKQEEEEQQNEENRNGCELGTKRNNQADSGESKSEDGDKNNSLEITNGEGKGNELRTEGETGGFNETNEDDDLEAQEIADLLPQKPSGCGMIIDAEEPESDMETEIAIRQSIGIAKRAGELPGHLKKLVGELTNPKADWRSELRRFMDPSSRKDFSWMRPNRRFSTAPFFLPGYVMDGVNHLGIVIDGSGSIDYVALKRGLEECQGALSDGGVDKVTVIYCDQHVYNIREYVGGDTIEILPAECGGTRFGPAFSWFADNAPDVSGIVYFTDMEAGDWEYLATIDAPPTLWAAYGDPRRLHKLSEQAPFGEAIEINY